MTGWLTKGHFVLSSTELMTISCWFLLQGDLRLDCPCVSAGCGHRLYLWHHRLQSGDHPNHSAVFVKRGKCFIIFVYIVLKWWGPFPVSSGFCFCAGRLRVTSLFIEMETLCTYKQGQGVWWQAQDWGKNNICAWSVCLLFSCSRLRTLWGTRSHIWPLSCTGFLRGACGSVHFHWI